MTTPVRLNGGNEMKDIVQPMNGKEDDPFVVVGYMCMVDFDCELGAASGGNRIFPSTEDLKAHLKCWESCGIVEVEVRASKVVLVGTDQC
jgi:hypothetical protein